MNDSLLNRSIEDFYNMFEVCWNNPILVTIPQWGCLDPHLPIKVGHEYWIITKQKLNKKVVPDRILLAVCSHFSDCTSNHT